MNTIVVGGGAAGLFAAGTAARAGASVIVLEKNKVLAKKVRISGKGRCNLTNIAPINQWPSFFPGNGRFLYSALHQLSNDDVVDFFHRLGVPTKVERGGRVFPVADDANVVADALQRYAEDACVEIRREAPVRRIIVHEGGVCGVVLANGCEVAGQGVVLATGGASYPKTGSSGDGYRLAAALGHNIIPLRPALVPINIDEPWVTGLAGLSLRNVEVWITNGKERKSEFGEMQFTHSGLSGPTVLTVSGTISQWLAAGQGPLQVQIDLKPALDTVTLDRRLQRDFQRYARKQLKNGLDDILPRALIPVIIHLSAIPADRPIHQITKRERQRLLTLIKGLPMTVSQLPLLEAAIVTAGGVDTRQVDPRTMESKVLPGLYFAGEVLDVDGVTGGYNLQAAFSTGYLAGLSSARKGDLIDSGDSRRDYGDREHP